FKQSPSVVLVDTKIIANAPTRFLVAGMGDALSTLFEARATARSFSNVNAGLPNGYITKETAPAKNTIAAYTLARVCYETLLENGFNAKIACDNNIVTPALENIVETNILLSGLGFESSGLAAVHAIHDGLTALEGTHHYFHGEKVAFSVICQLVLENAPIEELYEVLDFSLSIGLPVCLEDIGVESITFEEALEVAKKACIPEESIHSMPFPIVEEEVAQAIIAADQIGKKYKNK
ncbi:glycerol dehydrogenase, partial [Vagococcus fluvialis]